MLYTINTQQFNKSGASQLTALNAIEQGNIIYFPDGHFAVDELEQKCLNASILDEKHKNISYNPKNGEIGGLLKSLKNSEQEVILKSFMMRFANYATAMVSNHLSFYQEALITGRTSYRPVEIADRTSSKRKDDTRLHVDSFPASPVNGHRIMRFFCNINFEENPRVWQIGENFVDVINRFYPTVPKYNLFKAKILHWLKATKTLRSRYDHYMLYIHDNMKMDDDYQNTVNKQTIEFPCQSSWIVYTDQVSHAALKGQHLLEQTFYLPVEAMGDPSTAPLSILSERWEDAEAVYN